MGIQINGNTDNISATDGGLTVSDLELNQTGVSTFHSHLHVADQIIHLDDANSKIRFPAADTITAETAGSERFRITSSGQIGITKTPKEWNTDYRSLQIHDAGYIVGSTDDSFVAIGANNYLDTGGSYDYTNSDFASQLYQVDGTLVFRNAASGTADNAITWSEKFRIESSGGIKIPVVGTSIPVGGILHHTNNNLYVRGGTSGLILGNQDNTNTIHISESNYIKFETNDGSEKLRIDSSGHVGIGTDNPAVSLQGNWNKILEVSAGIHTGSMIRLTESGVGGGVNKGMLVGEHNNNAYLINYQNGFLQFRTNGLDRGRFDAAGRLLIGDSSVEGYGDADDLTISNTGANCGMTIRSNASGYSSIFFSDATSGTGEYDGFFQYGHSAQSLAIGAGSATKMTVYNNGNVVTRGNNNGNPIGMELKNENTAAYSHAQLTLTSQNATSSKVWCDVPNAKLRLQYNGGSTVDIDQSGNVHVPSGMGIHFGASGNVGTMNSEILDDYEEGYWTPTIGGHLSNGSTNYNNQRGAYVKIGSLIFLNCYISWSSTTASGQFRIYGMPYAVQTTYGTNYNLTTGSMMFNSITTPYQYGQMVPYISNNVNQIVFYGSYYTGGWSILSHAAETQNSGDMIFSISYRAGS